MRSLKLREPQHLNPAADIHKPFNLPPSSIPQPIPVDVDGDMKIDLLGIPASSTKLQIWQNVFNMSEPNSPLFKLCVIAFGDRKTV